MEAAFSQIGVQPSLALAVKDEGTGAEIPMTPSLDSADREAPVLAGQKDHVQDGLRHNWISSQIHVI
jgi:hypothetical protein